MFIVDISILNNYKSPTSVSRCRAKLTLKINQIIYLQIYFHKYEQSHQQVM